MKILLLIFGLIPFGLYSQNEVVPRYNKHKWEVAPNLAQLFGNSGGKSEITLKMRLKDGQLISLYDKRAVRLTLWFLTSSFTEGVEVNLGYEWQRIKEKKFEINYGFQIGYLNNSKQDLTDPFSYENLVYATTSGVLGFKYYLHPRISAYMESWLIFGYSFDENKGEEHFLNLQPVRKLGISYYF